MNKNFWDGFEKKAFLGISFGKPIVESEDRHLAVRWNFPGIVAASLDPLPNAPVGPTIGFGLTGPQIGVKFPLQKMIAKLKANLENKRKVEVEKKAGIVKEAGIVMGMYGHTHDLDYLINDRAYRDELEQDLGKCVADGDKIGVSHAYHHGLMHMGALMSPKKALTYARKFRKHIGDGASIKHYFRRPMHAGELEREKGHLHDIADDMESAAKSGKYKAFSLRFV